MMLSDFMPDYTKFRYSLLNYRSRELIILRERGRPILCDSNSRSAKL